jgi:hypothetical protein
MFDIYRGQSAQIKCASFVTLEVRPLCECDRCADDFHAPTQLHGLTGSSALTVSDYLVHNRADANAWPTLNQEFRIATVTHLRL